MVLYTPHRWKARWKFFGNNIREFLKKWLYHKWNFNGVFLFNYNKNIPLPTLEDSDAEVYYWV